MAKRYLQEHPSSTHMSDERFEALKEARRCEVSAANEDASSPLHAAMENRKKHIANVEQSLQKHEDSAAQLDAHMDSLSDMNSKSKKKALKKEKQDQKKAKQAAAKEAKAKAKEEKKRTRLLEKKKKRYGGCGDSGKWSCKL
eukprot:m.924811 g.924811  ORF g.924811 m.924811 type:complete len:142 (-) comp23772_c0_seq5:181-606(-)